ncbi:uncharacterized protein NECHADRAFT_84753 [Fusarium vanettenii 77-13-4]|uniref:Uncharacterized protein n=1 Tax=Fusarium vanettenii (strain ATCC MYA-4622 / CBS 123669 / FGSC 9596 / NRRL 45880 / 77-13-4) TaxID=660122 RepID=C7YTZ9_FUSV7|nr:uncharacterized protein NECHADRAFT_84753 [Fusarium vanettenii 77-13-4]EEU44714.1 predicted protein [Fusarium vanettenii 77-13-4]
MLPPPPNLDRLLALLKEYLAPKELGLPGGVAEEKELVWAEKDSPVKGEFITPGPWPSLAVATTTTSSSSTPPPASDAAPIVSPPGSSPTVTRRRRCRFLRRLFSSSSSSSS